MVDGGAQNIVSDVAAAHPHLFGEGLAVANFNSRPKTNEDGSASPPVLLFSKEAETMADDRIAKTMGVDELVQSITSATLRALKSEHPTLDFAKAGLFVDFRVHCGIPPVTDRPVPLALGAATDE
jgi:hypothetical protein